MKSSIKPILIVSLVLLMMSASAQEVKKQAGFRFGNTTGFTFKAINQEYFAFEGILGFRSGGAQFYGLLEARRPVFNNKLDNMHLYFGGGLHAGFVRWDDYYDDDDPFYNPGHYHSYYNHTGPAFGVDGVIGMEYSFPSVPITIAADFKPFFELYGPFLFRVNFWDFGFQVRYNF